MVLGRAILLLVGILCAGGPPPAGRSPEEDPYARRLSKILGEKVECARISPDGAYAALMLEKDLALTTTSGKVVWQRPKKAVNRWLTGEEDSAAAAPGGRRFAVTGGSGFRNVLLLDGSGRELAYLPTRGTPQGLAFDHRGERLAAGTASGWVYVVDLTSAGPGSLKSPPAFPVRAVHSVNLGGIVSDLAFSSDGHFLATTASDGTVALLDGSGKVIWRHKADFTRLVPSEDWKWFVVSEVPSHGPFYGSVSLVSRTGKELWSAYYRDPQAAISPDNRFVLVLAASGDQPSDPDKELPVEWRALDRQGHELQRTGKGDRFRFRAADGTVLQLHGVTWTATRAGRTLWTTRTEFYPPRTD